MNQNINVDLIPKFAVYGNLYFSQYDVGREAIINLVNGSTEYEIPSGATVTLVATKPSGLGFTQNCAFEGNQITVVCTAEMTDEAGHFPCEIRIANGSLLLGTANFTFNVERSPHPEGTTDGTADSVISQITVAFETAMDNIEHSGGLTSAIKNAILNCFRKVAWIDQNGQTYYNALSDALFAVTNITLNASSLLFNSIGSTQQLTATLFPSDSTAQVQWESSDTSVATVSSSGLVTSVEDGSATITASVGEVSATCSVSVVEITVESLNAVLNASGHTFFVGDDINDIKPYLTVTATYSDSTTATIPSGSYTLSGSLVAGENTITVSYEGVSTTVTVTAVASVLTSISAVYTQSGTVYTSDTLNSLKSDLVVTAIYSDSSTETVPSADYTLSGTLTEGTSAITVTYEGLTATFNVTVTNDLPSQYTWLYEAKDGELLSAQNYVTTASGGSGGSESLSNDLLVLTANSSTQGSASNFLRFNLTDTTTTNGKLSCRAKFVDGMEALGPTGVSSFRLQLSNGSSGAQAFFMNSNGNITVVYFEGGTRKTIDTNFSFNNYHIYEVELINGIQKFSIDGTQIFSSSTLSTNYCTANAILNQASTVAYNPNGVITNIVWLAYYEVA